MEKLDSQMNRFHSKKKNVQSTDGSGKGRMNSKRRKTILRESNIFDIPTKYEALSQSEKIANLQYHLLEIGTLTKNPLSPEYFDCFSPLAELKIETVCINFNSFLDETNCSVPDLEELPNPDMTDVPSFLGQNYQKRDCTRVLRSHKKASSTYHPFSL